MSKEEKVELLYLGESHDMFGIRHKFRAKKTKRDYLYWSCTLKGVWFGHSYWASKKEGTLFLETRPPRVSDEEQTLKPTDKEEKEFEVNRVAVKQLRAERQKTMKLKQPHPNILKAVELLAPFSKGMDYRNERLFFEWLKQECSKSRKATFKAIKEHEKKLDGLIAKAKTKLKEKEGKR